MSDVSGNLRPRLSCEHSGFRPGCVSKELICTMRIRSCHRALVAFRSRCSDELISAMRRTMHRPRAIGSIFEGRKRKKKEKKKNCRHSFIIKSPHRRTFISLRNTEHRGSPPFPGRRTLARDYERMEFLIKFPFSSLFFFFSFLSSTPMSRPPGRRRRRAAPRAFSFLSSGRGADKTPGVEVVGNNISVGVVMVAEY